MAKEEVVEQLERLTRRAEHVVVQEDLLERLREGRPLRVKLGLDPTASDVTLGWAVPLRKLRDFQDAGHTAVLIMGDFTARIGDPSGKSETRKQLTKEEVQAYAETCVDAVTDIVSRDNLEIRYNSEWLEPLDMADILRLTSRYTVARMLERDDFAKRYSDGRPISLVEFMYPLMQGYDSVAVSADIELGGTDQLFNLIVGRDLQRAYDQRPQICLTMPLLEGLDGVQKMSQSLGNYVSIRESPEEMFGQLMSIPDTLVGRYAFLAANMTDAEIKELERAVTEGGPRAGEAKRAVARRIVELYHGSESASAAESAFDHQFKDHQVPDDLLEVAVPADALTAEGKVRLPVFLAETGLVASRSEARRLISQGGLRVDGDTIQSEEVTLEPGSVLQVGKRKWAKVGRQGSTS